MPWKCCPGEVWVLGDARLRRLTELGKLSLGVSLPLAGIGYSLQVAPSDSYAPDGGSGGRRPGERHLLEVHLDFTGGGDGLHLDTTAGPSLLTAAPKSSLKKCE